MNSSTSIPNNPLSPLRFICAYPQSLQDQIAAMLENNSLAAFLKKKYPATHSISSDSALREYTQSIKQQAMRQSAPLSKVVYDGKIHVIHHALGTHTYRPRVQGNKIKVKNEIRISTLFKKVPEPFLNMIVVHELAHIKEKAHNKAFYQLCEHMQPDYHQLEFDMRLHLVLLDQGCDIFSQ